MCARFYCARAVQCTNAMELQHKKRKLIKSASKICFMYCHVCRCWCCWCFFCSSRACNVTCDTCTPTRLVYIPKSKSLSWMCVEIKKRARRETKSGIRIETERMKNCETKTEKKCGLCTRTLHALTRWFFSSILLLLYSYIHRFIITDCSYQWRPVSFIVDCVRWAYQAESFFFSNLLSERTMA